MNYPPDYEGADEPTEEQAQQRRYRQELDRDIEREEASNDLGFLD